MDYNNNTTDVYKYLFQTPPQKITMSKHYFPSVLDDNPTQRTEEIVMPVTKEVDIMPTNVQQIDPKYNN